MTLQNAITLLGPLDNTRPQKWADLGCGTGLFTRALATLLHPESTIYAIDKTRQDLPKGILFLQKNFEKDPLGLPPLDGILMANSMHYVKDKGTLIRRLQPPRFIIVEYDTQKSNPWVPYPIGKEQLKGFFKDMGYDQFNLLGDRPSAFGRARMYAATAWKT
ncbi:class I SAM-dependent methyltransferase [Dinghuibacter silviterrae]|uniref:Methyltransferase type 11 domain-containing protein n=1 Tax=Dinghuibacter silviterrae TaxID=1539049 RepID=A0A4R8DJX1_9BACT|nr:methyltransferase domain-containing protein [Dinghuibacter silviterrae]TDW97624.1 hypothetical protein EDB95_5475 [Dinghuibacter silviterrae]